MGVRMNSLNVFIDLSFEIFIQEHLKAVKVKICIALAWVHS